MHGAVHVDLPTVQQQERNRDPSKKPPKMRKFTDSIASQAEEAELIIV